MPPPTSESCRHASLSCHGDPRWRAVSSRVSPLSGPGGEGELCGPEAEKPPAPGAQVLGEQPLRTKQEAEKQQRRTSGPRRPGWPRSSRRSMVLQSQFHNLVMENRDTEQALRKVPWEGTAGRGPPGRGGQRGPRGHWEQRHGPTACRLCDLDSSQEAPLSPARRRREGHPPTHPAKEMKAP